MAVPDVAYAGSGDLSIAYHVMGEGPRDLVFTTLLISTVFSAEHEPFASFYRRLASFSRLILFDKRGTRASDRPRTPLTLEAQMEDVRAVLDDVGSEQAALFGSGHGAMMCTLFAATYPERTSSLILYNAWPRLPGTADAHRAMLRAARHDFGRRESIERNVREQYPSLANDQSFLDAASTIARATVSPGGAVDYLRAMADADVSEILPTIRVPTLVLYRRDLAPELAEHPATRQGAEDADQLASMIPNARAIGVPDPDIAPFVGDEIPTEVERFLTDSPTTPVPDTVLATFLFTDIVGSTERAAQLGDRAWRDRLAQHRRELRREIARYGGREIDTAGDGFFIAFDGPVRAILAAKAMIDAASRHGLTIRAGIHTGECQRNGKALAGIAVHIGARIAALAQPNELLVSRTVTDLVAGSNTQFDDRGDHQLKGVPGSWQLYAVAGSA